MANDKDKKPEQIIFNFEDAARKKDGEAVPEDDDFEMDTLSLIDEEGVEHEFEVVDAAEVEGKEYMALIPLYDEPEELLEDSGELVILRVSKETDESGEPFLEAILEEEEYDRVAKVFVGRLRDVFDFEDEDDNPVKH